VTSPPQYQPFYCEENVWQLCAHPALAGRELEVVFVSNAARLVAMWHQRAAPPGEAILWDYHVFVIAREPSEVWDLDTDLGAPVAAERYFAASFRPVAPEHAPRFRVVDASLFRSAFASDRSHMRRDGSGHFLKEPPPWPPIGAPGAASNLMSFVDTTADFLGAVVDLDALRARLR
jgi:protein N-terminal glutamine amidohydrolase